MLARPKTCSVREHMLGKPETWATASVPRLPSCVTSGKLLYLSVLVSSAGKWGSWSRRILYSRNENTSRTDLA